MFQGPSDDHTQAVWINGLCDVIVRSQLHRLNGGFYCAERRNQDDYGVRVFRSDLLQQVDSRDSRHTEVGDHEILGFTRKDSLGFLAAGRYRHGIAFVLELHLSDAT